MRTISRIFRIMALVTRILRRVIVHLVTPISLAAITDMTARDFVREIAAVMRWIFAYHYAANNDAQLSERYVAYCDATFCTLHMRFGPGDFWARHSRYNAGSFYPPLLCIWHSLFPAPLFQ